MTAHTIHSASSHSRSTDGSEPLWTGRPDIDFKDSIFNSVNSQGKGWLLYMGVIIVVISLDVYNDFNKLFYYIPVLGVAHLITYLQRTNKRKSEYTVYNDRIIIKHKSKEKEIVRENITSMYTEDITTTRKNLIIHYQDHNNQAQKATMEYLLLDNPVFSLLDVYTGKSLTA